LLTQYFAGKDVGKSGDDADRIFGLIWVASYAHILVKQYGDLFTTDGTHNLSRLGWRAIPICIVNSLGNPHAVCMAFCTSENSDVIVNVLTRLNDHCEKNGVLSPFRTIHPHNYVDARDLPLTDDLDESWICSPEWRNFVNSVLKGNANVALIPIPDLRTTWITDQGPAFLVVGRVFNLRHVLCKMHVAANNSLGSTSNSELGKKANNLIWGKHMSSTKAVRLCRKLVQEAETLPKSAETSKKWAKETFDDSMMKKSVMAFHLFVRTLSWRSTSCVENVFNIWKKFQSAALKRSELHDAITLVLNVCERRFQTDAMTIAKHPTWFINMTNSDDAKQTLNLVKGHEKKLGVARLFLKEKNKLQDVSICSWTDAIEINFPYVFISCAHCTSHIAAGVYTCVSLCTSYIAHRTSNVARRTLLWVSTPVFACAHRTSHISHRTSLIRTSLITSHIAVGVYTCVSLRTSHIAQCSSYIAHYIAHCCGCLHLR
jgi:hypothetical protein